MSIVSAQGYIGDTFANLGSFTVPASKFVGDAPFTLTPPTSLSTQPWVFTSSDPSIISISGTTATVSSTNTGSVTITATQQWSPFYGQNVITATCIVTPISSDAYWSNVALLINGEQSPIVDLKGNSLTIPVVTNLPTQSTSVVKFGSGSVYFNGSSAYKIPPSTAFNIGTSNFTIECWVYPLAYGGSIAGGAFFQANSLSQLGYAFHLGESQARCRFTSRGTGAWADNVVAAVGPALNTWSHVAVVRNGTSLKIYVNGVQQGSVTIAAGFNLVGGASNSATVGFLGDGGTSRYLNGYMDDLRVTNGIARYTANFTPPTTFN